MWFNSKQRAKPYQSLTWLVNLFFIEYGKPVTGVAWLSSARVVRCLVRSFNERNPHEKLFRIQARIHSSFQTAGDKLEEGEDDVKSSWPLWAGLHTCYNGRYNGRQWRESERILKAYRSSDCSLQLESMKSESLVIVDQHATVNLYLGLVLPARHALRVRGVPNHGSLE